MKRLWLPLILYLIAALTLPCLAEITSDGTVWLSADAGTRQDYFDLIQNNAVLNIRVPKENPYFRDIDGVLFSKDGANLLLYPNGRPDKEYAVPEGTKTIEEECSFGYDCQLERLILPASFESIGGAGLFRTVIREFVVGENNPHLKAVDGVLFTRDGKTLVAYPPGRTDEFYRVPEGAERIGDWAFTVNEHLVRVEMPDSLLAIGNYAFDECEKLRSVRLPERMEALGKNAFGFCYDLEEITLPEGIDALPKQVLVYDHLSGALHIPHTVRDIGGEALCHLHGLTDIYLPDGLETICGKYTADNFDVGWGIHPLYYIYGWNDTGIADYTVVFHAHEGTFGAELLENSGGFPYVIAPVGQDAPDAAEYARLLTEAMARCGHPDAVICQNDSLDWLLVKPLIAYTLHQATAVFRENDKLLLCGFDDADGAWTLKWVNDQLLRDGVKPVMLSYYGENEMELILPDPEYSNLAMQYLFRWGVLAQAHAYRDFLFYECREIWQCLPVWMGSSEYEQSTLRFAQPDDYDFDGYDENGRPTYTRTPGEEIMYVPVEANALHIEHFAGVTLPEE